MQGRQEALKWAITFLHAKAETMNDPKAKAILNVAATDMGNFTRDGGLPHVNRLFCAPSHLNQVPKVYEETATISQRAWDFLRHFGPGRD